jgi:hypothetical protein
LRAETSKNFAPHLQLHYLSIQGREGIGYSACSGGIGFTL